MWATDSKGNCVHSTAIVFEGVQMGKNNILGPYCVIYPNTVIGDYNKFTSHCSVGATAQHKEFENNHDKKLIIGNRNVFREFCTLHLGTTLNTVIGNDNYLMAYCHVPHDANLGNNITIANGAQIGGYTIIEDYANLGLNCVIHQFSLIGMGSMIGMGCIVPKKKRIEPFTVYVNSPAEKLKENKYLIDKLKIDLNDISKHRLRYSRLFIDKFLK